MASSTRRPLRFRHRASTRRRLSRRDAIRLGASGAMAFALNPTASAFHAENFGTYAVGLFSLTLSPAASGTPSLRVTHSAEPERVLWESIPGESFLAAGVGVPEIAENTTPASGFNIRTSMTRRFDVQSVASVSSEPDSLLLHGSLSGDGGAITYTMTWTSPGDAHLRFEVTLSGPGAEACNISGLRYAAGKGERFFGFGQQMTYADQTGRLLPILVQEHGVGRGLPIITPLIAARFGRRTAGTWYSTEVSVPHYLTNQSRSLLLETTDVSQFDLSQPGQIEITALTPALTGRILYGRTPLELISAYTEYAGRMRALPDWIHKGAIVAVQGGTPRAQEKLEALANAGVPVAAFWIQDWVGQRTTPAGHQLRWDWQLDETHYPGWNGLLQQLQDRLSARMLIYINPFLANQEGRDHLYQEALKSGYLVKTQSGDPYMIPNAGFSAALLDLSNEDTWTWIKGVIKDEMLSHAGASGWMADFGEALPFDAVLASGESPTSWHNRYPEEWAKVNREAIEEAGKGDDVVFFSRSGYTKSPASSTLFWLGDQLQTWDEHDGIKTAVVGALSGGISGLASSTATPAGSTRSACLFLARRAYRSSIERKNCCSVGRS